MELNEFTKNLQIIDKFSDNLTPQAFYIAGFASLKIPIEKSLKYLNMIQVAYDMEKINDTNKALLEFRLWQGQLNQAKEFLRKISKQKPDEFGQDLERRTLTLIHKLTAEIEREKTQKRKAQQEKRKREQAHKCKICSDSVDEHEFLPLENCGEIFHPSCIKESILQQIQQKQIPKCVNCSMDIAMIDLRDRLSVEEFRQYEDLTFNALSNGNELSCCPTPGCKYLFVWAEDAQEFECPLCKTEYCLGCRTKGHPKLSCAQNRNTREYKRLNIGVKKEIGNFKSCPKCKFWVRRTNNELRLQCKCKNVFCFDCGGSPCKCA